MQTLYEKQFYKESLNEITLHVGDARHTIKSLSDDFYDVVFLDPFLYTQNVTLITKDFLALVVQKMTQDGILVCATSIEAVRIALSQLGFSSEVVQIPQTDIKGIVAKRGKQYLEGSVYEDPYLVYRDKQIITNREIVLKQYEESKNGSI